MRRRAPRYQRSHFHPHTRVGCDAPNQLRRPKCGKFRSPPPRGESSKAQDPHPGTIFRFAPPAEGDIAGRCAHRQFRYFNLPSRGRQEQRKDFRRQQKILLPPSQERTVPHTAGPGRIPAVLPARPAEERDHGRANCTHSRPLFRPTPRRRESPFPVIGFAGVPFRPTRPPGGSRGHFDPPPLPGRPPTPSSPGACGAT